MNNRALITGISGFSGRYMRIALENGGFDVFAFSHNKTSASKILNVDLCDYAVVFDAINKIKPNIVVYLAGIFNVNYSNINELLSLNIVGSRNLKCTL